MLCKREGAHFGDVEFASWAEIAVRMRVKGEPKRLGPDILYVAPTSLLDIKTGVVGMSSGNTRVDKSDEPKGTGKHEYAFEFI